MAGAPQQSPRAPGGIFGNKQRGIYVSADSSAELADNDVFGNAAGDVVEE